MAATAFDIADLPPGFVEALSAWERLRGDRFAPGRRDIDPALFRTVLANVVLFDVIADPLDFSYRLIGTEVRRRIRRNLAGVRFSAIEHQRPGSAIFSDYERVVAERRPLFGDIRYVGPDEQVRFVRHLLMPLSDDGERVTGVLTVIEYVPTLPRQA
jgi:hypothetical protein